MMRTRFLARPENWLALVLVGTFVLAALAAPLLAPPDDPSNPAPFKLVGQEQDLVPHPPSGTSVLGTAPGQLDVYYTLIWGTRSALLFGLVVAGVAALFGSLYGAVAAYAGGWINQLFMRFADALIAFPVVVAVWLFEAVVLVQPSVGFEAEFGEQTVFQGLMNSWHVGPLLLSLLLFAWMPYARVVNAGVLVVLQSDFVLAARAIGVGRTRILLRYLLPNAVAPSIVLWARDVGGVVVLGTTFAFIGLGKGLEWATMLATARGWIFGTPGNVLAYWWVYVPYTLALVLFGSAWGLLGDGLNAALDPQD